MKKWMGAILLLGGITAYLYGWISDQKMRQKRLEEYIVFLQKSIFAMQTEKVKLIVYFQNYSSKDEVLNETLWEIAERLKSNLYPNGYDVWRDELEEKKVKWGMEEETFALILKSGEGFFGRNREENICFLHKSLCELEEERHKTKEKYVQQRKVWIPVGLLSGIMLIIVFI